MILKSLQLRNFRSFREASVVFGHEQNYIVGSNWQGKSSLVEGVAFALFGGDSLPRKLAGSPVKAEHLLTDETKRGHVELVFMFGDRDYTLRRTLPGSTVTLLRDGDEIASGKRRVDEELSDLLAIDAKFFLNVFYADQDDLRRSFDLAPADRKLFIERLMGQETWQERVDGLRRAEKHLRRFMEDLASGRFGAFVTQLDELTDEIADDAREMAELRKTIAALRKSLPDDRPALRRQERTAEGKVAKLEHSETALVTGRDFLARLAKDLAKGACPTCTQAVPAGLRRRRLIDLRRQMAESSSELRKIRRELDGLRSKLEDEGFDEASTQMDELRWSEGEYKALEREHIKKAEREKRVRREARVFGKRPQQHERARAELAFLQRLIDVIQEHRTALRGQIVGQLITGMNDILARFHDGDFDVEAAIDADLNLRVRLHGKEVPLTNLSGAAKDIFALSLRYGLMRVAARRVDCFILDEPTRHMDIKNVRRLKTVLDDLVDRQLIVVTVQEEFADARGKHFSVSKDAQLCSVVSAS